MIKCIGMLTIKIIKLTKDKVMNIMNYETKDGILYFEGCNTLELAKEYGTPLYVMSESIIVEKCREINRSFLQKYKRTRAAYAAKAFLTLAKIGRAHV